MNQCDRELIKQLGLKTKDKKLISRIVNFLDSDQEKKEMIELLKRKNDCSRSDILTTMISVSDRRIKDDIIKSKISVY